MWRHPYDAWRHQAITWTNVDLSSNMFCGIHMKAIKQKMHMNFFGMLHLENSQPHLQGTKELT